MLGNTAGSLNMEDGRLPSPQMGHIITEAYCSCITSWNLNDRIKEQIDHFHFGCIFLFEDEATLLEREEFSVTMDSNNKSLKVKCVLFDVKTFIQI